ncbi:MAG TPA: caspase family protein [Gemmatimonadaceae bacterium]|nr:caspase family protein [Gemmatimonadaceae bacterium]
MRVLALLVALTLPQSPREWTLGSPATDVAAIEGPPDFIERLSSLRYESWHYGKSWIRLSFSERRVVSWYDAGNLKMRRDPADASANVPSARAPHAGRDLGAVLPAALSAGAELADDGDGILEADERLTITMAVRNAGPGVARGLRVTVASSLPSAVSIVTASPVEALGPGKTATLTAVIAASHRITDGKLTLTVGVSEASGFDLDPPVTFGIVTRAFHAPHFALTDIAVADQSGNGRIEPREITDITARVRNTGGGTARDVRISVLPGTDVFLTPGTNADLAVGNLRSGSTRDIHFSAFTNSRATGFPVSVIAHDARGFTDTIPLGLTLDRPLSQNREHTVRGSEGDVREAAPLIIDVDTGVPRGVSHNTIAVVLGAERYQRAPAVPFARHDALVFREYATQLFGADSDNVIVRTDDDVTGGELRKIFGDGGWLARRVSSGSDVVVYFAGHGIPDLATHAPYLLPNDGDPSYPAQTGYALNELYERLAALGARSVTVFIDACFSGGTRDGASLFRGARDVVVSVEHPALRSPTMAVFTASAANELASSAADRGHGLFTYWLLRALKGDADATRTGAITVGALSRFLAEHVPRDALRQERVQHPFTVARDTSRVVVTRR